MSALVLAGCGFNGTTVVPEPATNVLPTIQGTAYGGTIPIVNAKVTLWQTQSNGYPSATVQAVSLATTTTTAGGSFIFTNPTYTCATGQYVYITVTGGNTNGFATNNQAVDIAALGSCSNFSGAAADALIRIIVNEVSTVAAGYALGNFMYIDNTTPGSQKVYITAPANNNAAAPACTGSGTGLTCTAGGLGHAFANALYLVDSVRYNVGLSSGTAVTPTGAAYSVAPSNANSSVPTALINTIADALEYCVNSAGGAPCTTLFGYATPPGGTAPANTLQAVVNMAKNPTTNAANIANLASSFSSFLPILTAAPNDLSLAVVYTGTVTGGTPAPFAYPTSFTLDAADNVYVAVADAATPTMTGVAGLTSNGSTIFGQAVNNSTSLKIPGYQSATDNLGHVWTPDIDAAGTLRGINTADGSQYVAITTTANTNPVTPALATAAPAQTGPSAIGVDKSNNLWACRKTGVAAFEFTYTSGATPTYANGAGVTQAVGCTNISFDASQNVWFTDNTSSASKGTVGVSPISATGTYPSQYPTDTATKQVAATNLNLDYGIAINSSGVGFTAAAAGVASFTPTLTSGVVSALTEATVTTQTLVAPGTPAFDGINTLFFTDATTTNGGGPIYVVAGITPSSGTPISLLPCSLPNGASTCSTVSAASAGVDVQADSTGSLWLVSPTQGTLVQVIGTAAPTWPAYFYGKPGTIPQ